MTVFVSILVLMDLALEFYTSAGAPTTLYGFNPCFNGSCSRILSIRCVISKASEVKVSILVLMDLALELSYYNSYNVAITSFNPCFNGSCSRISPTAPSGFDEKKGFNPCFNGSCSRMRHPISI